MRSSSGNITDEEVPPSTYTANNQLNSGKLSAGGSVEGDIIFQVPKADHNVNTVSTANAVPTFYMSQAAYIMSYQQPLSQMSHCKNPTLTPYYKANLTPLNTQCYAANT